MSIRTPKRSLAPESIHCYDCLHNYDYLGFGTHPGVCPTCGSEAVSLSGDVEAVDIYIQELDEHEWSTFDVVVKDSTPRSITFSGTLCDGLATIETAGIGSARIQAGTNVWRTDLVPESVIGLLEDSGYKYVPCTDREGPGEEAGGDP